MDKGRKQSVSEYAYNLIKKRIMSGEYEPMRMLNEVSLSKEIGVSRTPIRDALSRLENEMLVKTYPKQGTMISPVDLNVVSDVFQIRIMCEPFVILHYGAQIDRERIVVARRVQRQISLDQSTAKYQYEADEDLHRIILDANPNKYITEILTKAFDQNYRIRVMTGAKSEERLLQSNKEHLEIINSLLRNDYVTAAERMKDHLEASWQATIDMTLAE